MGSPDQPTGRKDGLQLNEHHRFQERFWAIERIAWCVFALIIVAGLFGAFGSGGPLATKATVMERAIVEHPRIGRWEGAGEMMVRFTPDPSAHTRSLFLSNSFAEIFQVEDIQPLPVRTIIEASGQRLFFDNPGLDGGLVTLHLRAQSAGSVSFGVGIDGEMASLSSFIFP